MTTQVRRSAYDTLYRNDWNRFSTVSLYNHSSRDEPATNFEGIMNFAQFMSRQLGFRLRVRFFGRNVYFTKES
jgi:hypothetical protein